MKPTKHLALLSMGLSMAIATPIAMAQNPSEKTNPERKMVTDDDEKGKTGTPETATVDENRAKLEDQAAAIAAALAKPAEGSIADVVAKSATFSTLKTALTAAGLNATLSEPGAYTVFAPTDEAFDKLPTGTLGKLMLPENKEKLRSLLLYHVVAGTVKAADLKDGEVKTMNGEKLKVDVDGKDIEVNDAKVFSADVPATNGVIHSVGTVLIPKSLDGFADLKD